MSPVKFIKPNRKIDRVFLHCSASDVPAHDNVETMRKWHKEKGWDDIGYHFFISKNGVLHRGRDIEKTPAAQKGHNLRTIAVCMHGLRKEKFTQVQYEALKTLCTDIDAAYSSKVSFHGHTEVSNKTCPVFDYKEVLKLDKYGSLGLNNVIIVDERDLPALKIETVDINDLPDLKTGSRGRAVEFLQMLLFIKEDGIFGPNTGRAVKAFKKKHDFYPSDIVQKHIWKLLIDMKSMHDG